MTTIDWQFWIDVGGTFTDCFARRADGGLLRHKVLSSGVTKGCVGDGSNGSRVVDRARRVDPQNFWRGYRLRLLDRQGQVVEETSVTDFERESGVLRLASPLSCELEVGQPYELVSGEEAPILAIRYLLGLKLNEPIPPAAVRLGTTRGTNALITRRGAKTALVTTKGFGDILHIGYQNRPRLFDLAIKKPAPLFAAVAEIDERVTPGGEVLTAAEPTQIRECLAELRQQGIESLGICLLNAYAHGAHEELVERIAREVGFEEISVSSRVAPLIKIVSRGDTTIVDAYLNPVLRRYVQRLRQSLRGVGFQPAKMPRPMPEEAGWKPTPRNESDLRILTSAGGLVDADRFVGKDSILSGPAGGVVGFSKVAQAAGFQRAIGFDMGGTSTDVSRFDGRYELQYETEKAGVRVVAPMMAIETVAAGGGSICHFDGVKLAVGPDSAGADPGPACYGRGGPLAVTDVNFYLGKILPEHFPFPLDRNVVRQRLSALCDEIERATGKRYEPAELADGFLRVANANMAKAIRSISIAKGYDPRDYVLVAFGGAAPQHACAVARELGIRQILNHPDAGILSAYGIGMADVVRHRAEGVYQPYSEAAVANLAETFQRLTDEARREVLDEGIAPDRIEVIHSLDLRYRGFDAYLTIACPPNGNYADAYVAEHERLYGYTHENRPLEIVAARVEVIGRSGTQLVASHRVEPSTPEPATTVTAYFDAQQHETNVFDRASLQPGDVITGPAIVVECNSTTVIDPGWQAEMLSGGELLLVAAEKVVSDSRRSTESSVPSTQYSVPSTKSSDSTPPFPSRSSEVQLDNVDQADPVMLEIFNNQFAGIAEQMGITLRNTSSSVNVKERLDFSCALFTPTGDLVVNAPHIPVHLGAMGETVRRIIADNPDMQPGDVFVTNDPYRGGSHLPDVTVVTPVFSFNRIPNGVREHDATRTPLGMRLNDEVEATESRVLFYTASRAHHAEIGGITPGSMPPFSKNLAEEGVLIRNFKAVAAGRSRTYELRDLLLSAPFPTRNVHDNLADIAAQIAANNQGARDLLRLVERYTLPIVEAYMRHIQDAAEHKMRAALSQLPPGRREFVDHLDDGSPICVAITINGDSAVIDFTGTGPVLPGNLNANRAIVTAAVMYCMRCLIAEDIPLNQGVLAPIEIIVPECLLSPPERERPEDCAAVVGGNVETSQRVVDTLLGALDIAAASQGTMNNVLFGDKTFGYYETICGGSGATEHSDGADAVHTHMTNTRLTDPEVLEQRYPVRVREFSIRRGSGGRGEHRGGDGVTRRLEFLRDLEVSLVAQRRGPYPPYGLSGGQPGALGQYTLTSADGTHQKLAGIAHFTARRGDVLTIETPGGGGFGEPSTSPV